MRTPEESLLDSARSTYSEDSHATLLAMGPTVTSRSQEEPPNSQGPAVCSGTTAIGPRASMSSTLARFFFPSSGFGRSASRTDAPHARFNWASLTTSLRQCALRPCKGPRAPPRPGPLHRWPQLPAHKKDRSKKAQNKTEHMRHQVNTFVRRALSVQHGEGRKIKPGCPKLDVSPTGQGPDSESTKLLHKITSRKAFRRIQ